jgi:hypothetical protein
LRFQSHPVRTGRFQMPQRHIRLRPQPVFTARWDGRCTGVSGLVGPARSRCPALQIDGKVAKEYSSPHADTSDQGLNYIRSSVKAAVDMYDGTVRFYVMDPNQPRVAV